MRQSVFSLIVILGSSLGSTQLVQRDSQPNGIISASDYLPESPIIGLTPPARDGVDSRVDRPPFRRRPPQPPRPPPSRKRTKSRYRNNAGTGKRMRRPKGPFKVVGKRKTCTYRRKLVNQPPPRFQRRSDPNNLVPHLILDDSHRHGRSHSKRNLLAGHLGRERTMKYYNNLPNHGQAIRGYSPISLSAGKYDFIPPVLHENSPLRTFTRSLLLREPKEAAPFGLNLNNYRILIREYSYRGDGDSDEQIQSSGAGQRRRVAPQQFYKKRPGSLGRRNGYNKVRTNHRQLHADFRKGSQRPQWTNPLMVKKSVTGIHHKSNLLPNTFHGFNTSRVSGISSESKEEDEVKQEDLIIKPVTAAYSGSINQKVQPGAIEEKKTEKIYSSVIRSSAEDVPAPLVDLGLHNMRTTAINSNSDTPLTLMEPNKSRDALPSYNYLSRRPTTTRGEVELSGLTTESPGPTTTTDVIYVTPEPYSSSSGGGDWSGGLTGNTLETMTVKTISSSYRNHLDYQRDDGLIDFSKQLNVGDHARMKKLMKSNAVSRGLLANGWRPIYPNPEPEQTNEWFKTVTIAPNKHWVALMKK